MPISRARWWRLPLRRCIWLMECKRSANVSSLDCLNSCVCSWVCSGELQRCVGSQQHGTQRRLQRHVLPHRGCVQRVLQAGLQQQRSAPTAILLQLGSGSYSAHVHHKHEPDVPTYVCFVLCSALSHRVLCGDTGKDCRKLSDIPASGIEFSAGTCSDSGSFEAPPDTCTATCKRGYTGTATNLVCVVNGGEPLYNGTLPTCTRE